MHIRIIREKSKKKHFCLHVYIFSINTMVMSSNRAMDIFKIWWFYFNSKL